MQFNHDSFSCAVDIYSNNDDLVIRFYDTSKEHKEEQMVIWY